LKIATRSDWKTLPLPEQRAPLRLDLRLDAREVERVTAGHIPADMDDKWFIYLEGSELFLHRSWTGVCVYRASLDRHDDGTASITSASVNRNSSEYAGVDDEYDRLLLRYLIERMLAGRDVPFPVPASSKSAPPGLFQHHVAGSGNREVEVPDKPG